jgi:hypothetical protein
MQHPAHLVFETDFGSVYSCLCGEQCTLHVEFGNIVLDFNQQGFDRFRDNLNSTDFKACEAANTACPYKRKLILSFEQVNVHGAFNQHEINQLKILINGASMLYTQQRLSAVNEMRLN